MNKDFGLNLSFNLSKNLRITNFLPNYLLYHEDLRFFKNIIILTINL